MGVPNTDAFRFRWEGIPMSCFYRGSVTAMVTISVIALTSGANTLAAEPSFRGLGGFPGVKPPESNAYGVSADGSTVVGSAQLGNNAQAFRWTESTGLRGLGARPAGVEWTIGRAASADGS